MTIFEQRLQELERQQDEQHARIEDAKRQLVALEREQQQLLCDHKFIDSDGCVKCGWRPGRGLERPLDRD